MQKVLSLHPAIPNFPKLLLLFMILVPAISFASGTTLLSSGEQPISSEQAAAPSVTPDFYEELGLRRAAEAASFYQSWEKNGNITDLQKALVYADSATQLAPDHEQGWVLLGMIHSVMHSDEEALLAATDAFIRAIDINPANGAAQLLLAHVLMRQGRFWSAIEQYESLFDKSEAMITGINTAPLALSYVLDNRTLAGIQYFQQLSAKHPDKACLMLPQAVLLHSNGGSSEAMALLNKVINSDSAKEPDRDYARQLLAKWNQGVQP